MSTLNHVAIIPDGNRRWARARSLPTAEGHRRGFSSLEKIAKRLREQNVHTFTVWAFSTENWNREADEVEYLMRLYETWLKTNLKIAMRDKIKIIHLGRKDRIKDSLRTALVEAEEKTKDFTDYTLGFAVDYGGHDEIWRAAKAMAAARTLAESPQEFASFLDTKDFAYPEPDLVIRTSGEHRTSGFMTWQAAYAEWIFHDKFLPDFTVADLDACIEEYHQRHRRFGK